MRGQLASVVFKSNAAGSLVDSLAQGHEHSPDLSQRADYPPSPKFGGDDEADGKRKTQDDGFVSGMLCSGLCVAFDGVFA